MKIIGLTGGVGSGKSRILYLLQEKYDAYVIEADKLAHQLMQIGGEVYNEILSDFGKEILDKDGNIDRKILGSIVFNSEQKLIELNNITHPIVKKEIKKIIKEKQAENRYNLVIIEAALLIQDGYKEICDEIWFVQVDVTERIKRLAAQRGYSREKSLEVINSQPDDEFYINGSDYVIPNNSDFEKTSLEIEKILK